ANAIGGHRIRQLCEKYGPDVVLTSMDELMAYSERRIRAAIAAIPDGVYEGEDFIDDDGYGSGPLPVKVKVTIDGDTLAMDFAGTCGQVRGNINCPFASTVS